MYKRQTLIRDVSRITHHNDEAYIGALAVFIAIQGAFEGNGLDLLKLAGRLPDSRVCDGIYTLSTETDRTIQEVVARHGASGFVAESVPLALLAAKKSTELGFENTLAQVIMAGGDTDTIASITGQIIGAEIGFPALPERLIKLVPQIQGIEVFAAFAYWAELHLRSQSDV